MRVLNSSTINVVLLLHDDDEEQDVLLVNTDPQTCNAFGDPHSGFSLHCCRSITSLIKALVPGKGGSVVLVQVAVQLWVTLACMICSVHQSPNCFNV